LSWRPFAAARRGSLFCGSLFVSSTKATVHFDVLTAGSNLALKRFTESETASAVWTGSASGNRRRSGRADITSFAGTPLTIADLVAGGIVLKTLTTAAYLTIRRLAGEDFLGRIAVRLEVLLTCATCRRCACTAKHQYTQ